MRFFRKLIVYGMITVILASVLTGCGQKEKSDVDFESFAGQNTVIPFATDSGGKTERSPEELVQKDELTAEAAEIIALLNEKWEQIRADMGDSLSGYLGQRKALEDLYALGCSESWKLYELLGRNSQAAYDEIAKCVDNSDSAANDLLDRCFNICDEVMSDYYEAWDELYDNVFMTCNEIIENAPDRETPDKTDAVWNEMFQMFQISWENQYEAHSEAWRSLYKAYETVWWEVYNDDRG